jgi:hypothetical protein
MAEKIGITPLRNAGVMCFNDEGTLTKLFVQ